MANEYATLAQIKAHLRITSTDTADDALLSDLLTRASRLIDTVTGRWFYTYAGSRKYDYPDGECLSLQMDLVSVSSITNGDGTTLAASDYVLEPAFGTPKYAVKLRSITSNWWQPSPTSGPEQCITVTGNWGYVDRTATDPASLTVISNTEQACILIVQQWYHERAGNNVGGSVTVTASGVVITPAGALPKSAYDLIRQYVRRL